MSEPFFDENRSAYVGDVANGARLLDRRIPDWFQPNRVDLDTLNVENPRDCVVGQLYRGEAEAPVWPYSVYVDADFIAGKLDLFGRDYAYSETYDHGFDLRWPSSEGYRQLTSWWKQEIRNRRAIAGTPFATPDLIGD